VLELGLLGRVVVPLGATHRDVLGQPLGVVGMKPVGRDGGGVDQAPRAGLARRLEHGPGAVEVHPARVLARAHDREGQVHDHVGAGHQLGKRTAVEHVPAPVVDLAQPLLGRVERPPRERAHRADLARSLERAQQRAADVAGRAGDRHGQPGGRAARSRAAAHRS
jgi:hypothetical protein